MVVLIESLPSKPSLQSVISISEKNRCINYDCTNLRRKNPSVYKDSLLCAWKLYSRLLKFYPSPHGHNHTHSLYLSSSWLSRSQSSNTSVTLKTDQGQQKLSNSKAVIIMQSLNSLAQTSFKKMVTLIFDRVQKYVLSLECIPSVTERWSIYTCS